MKMKKRIIMQVVSLLLIATMALAGCSSSGSGGETKDKEVTNQESTPVVPEETSASKEKVEFSATFIMTDWGTEADNYETLNQMQEEANVHIEWSNYLAGDWNTQKNLILAGGELPDVFVGFNALNAADIAKYAKEGMLLDLTDLIPQYMPNLNALLEKYPYLKKMITNPDDGKIYNLPNASGQDFTRCMGMMYINKTWLDRLGLSVPTTTDEFYNVLKAFKEQDANGNGDKTDEIPFSCYGNLEGAKLPYTYANLFGSFGAPENFATSTPHFVKNNETGEVVYVPTTDGYKDAIKYMNTLVKEGLWDTESFTYTDLAAYNAKIKSDPASVGAFFEWQFLPSYSKDEYIELPPLKGPNGEQNWMFDEFKASKDLGQINPCATELTVAAQGKEEAILKFFDLAYDFNNAIQLYYGADGSVITKGGDGKYTYNETPSDISWSEWRYANAPVWFPFVIEPSSWDNLIPVMPDDSTRNEIVKANYDPYMTYSDFVIKSTVEESKILSSVGEDIKQYVNMTQTRWIAQGGIEEEWETYLKNLEDLGLEDFKNLVIQMQQRME